jgi:hypothetical protein
MTAIGAHNGHCTMSDLSPFMRAEADIHLGRPAEPTITGRWVASTDDLIFLGGTSAAVRMWGWASLM